MFKEAGILIAITLIAGILLGYVNELTKEPIAKQKKLQIENACKTVMADASTFDEKEYVCDEATAAKLGENRIKSGKVYEAKSESGDLLGYVIETTSPEGYGGDIVLYTGIDMEGTVKAVSILSISETAGLGMNAESVLVPQFKDKNAERFTYTKNGATSDSEIDAISGATITTKAFTNAVNGALDVFRGLTGGESVE
ncbi:MAG: RnfABCDGE type electron transport complex subunit G [Lachnospiraceae bacterium]|nr:RnfABCDGE type electron transport complex subunit G [Lachnospiraceae bacterium]